jgi:hypothetical protein
MWVPNPWQENLLWHFLRTGDYWCGPTTRLDYNPSAAIIMVGGSHGDLKKLYAIKSILFGGVRRASDWYRGPSTSPWEYMWISSENTEEYLRWFEDKWENHGIIDSPPRRRWVKECLEAFDAYRSDRYDDPKSA